jgi:hypothetical protein
MPSFDLVPQLAQMQRNPTELSDPLPKEGKKGKAPRKEVAYIDDAELSNRKNSRCARERVLRDRETDEEREIRRNKRRKYDLEREEKLALTSTQISMVSRCVMHMY